MGSTSRCLSCSRMRSPIATEARAWLSLRVRHRNGGKNGAGLIGSTPAYVGMEAVDPTKLAFNQFWRRLRGTLVLEPPIQPSWTMTSRTGL